MSDAPNFTALDDELPRIWQWLAGRPLKYWGGGACLRESLYWLEVSNRYRTLKERIATEASRSADGAASFGPTHRNRETGEKIRLLHRLPQKTSTGPTTDQAETREEQRQMVRRYAEGLGVTPTELARRAGIAPSTLTRFLNVDTDHLLSVTTINKIRRACGVMPAPDSVAICQDEDGRMFAAPARDFDNGLFEVILHG